MVYLYLLDQCHKKASALSQSRRRVHKLTAVFERHAWVYVFSNREQEQLARRPARLVRDAFYKVLLYKS